MSMTLLTILQVIWVSAAYLGVTLLLPWLLLRRRLAQFRLPARFMAYCMAGNFFCINLVYLLQLLHISSQATLIIGTLIPFLVVAVKYRKRLLELLKQGMDRIGSFSEGEVGAKTAALHMKDRVQRFSAGWLARWLAPRWLDALLAAGVILLVLLMYGINTVSVYGYCASDLLAHNNWINCMEHNQIFVDGVCPFGFHCVIYYLHEVFAIPTYVLLRVFTLPQNLMVHLMLLAFLKLVCKSKYAPYAGIVAYLTTAQFYQLVYGWFYAPQPQVYGMIFILPVAYFAMVFLKNKNFVAGAEGRAEELAKYSLVLFSIGISVTLTVNFYDIIVVGLLCVGIGVGFCSQFLRWQHLKRFVLAGAAGLLIGVLPMAVAYASGTPLQSSYWGMNTISDVDEAADAGSTVLVNILKVMRGYVASDNLAAAVFMLCSVGVLLALGLIWWLIMHRPDYGGMLVSFGVFMGLMCVLQAAPRLGFSSPIDVLQWAMYIRYGLAVVWSLCVDAAAYLLFQKRQEIHLAGLAGFAAACVVVALTGIRTPVCVDAYESNGAITCLTNILQENGDSTSWTVCSANDERQMIWDCGYHYETINFLRGQENLTEDTYLTIPTDTVYFFIEKVPIHYLDIVDTVKPDREVSQEGAKQPLPAGDGLEAYRGDARWVTMSHMYYWAQEFQKLYPYEMEVYYETDDFVCYRIRQDGYNLYNLAIDYGYNA